jgi:hypothetical protein
MLGKQKQPIYLDTSFQIKDFFAEIHKDVFLLWVENEKNSFMKV